jgi:hypothetical protein
MGLNPCRVRIPWTFRSDLWQGIMSKEVPIKPRRATVTSCQPLLDSRQRGEPQSIVQSVAPRPTGQSWQLGEERQHLRPSNLSTDHHLACRVDAVHLKYRLGDRRTDRNRTSRGSLLLLCRSLRSRMRRAVHSLRTGRGGRTGFRCQHTCSGADLPKVGEESHSSLHSQRAADA